MAEQWSFKIMEKPEMDGLMIAVIIIFIIVVAIICYLVEKKKVQ